MGIGDPPGTDGPPATLREEARRRDMSGADMVRAWVSGEVPAPPLAQHLGIRPVDVGDGAAELTLTVQPFHANAGGIVHGGVAASLIDSATGTALWTRVEAGTVIATVDLNVSYLRAVPLDVGTLTCRASVVHLGEQLAVVDGTVTGADGTAYVSGRATYAIIR